MTTRLRPNLTVTDRVPAVLAAIEAMVKDRVYVGIPAEKAQREPEPDDPMPSITNAEIGYINEFGAPEMNIPARPFLVPGVRRVLEKIEDLYFQGAKAALDGKLYAIERAHVAAGLTAATGVQTYMTTAQFIALSPVTLAKRKARGFKGEKPLIETGQLRRSITYVIHRDGMAMQTMGQIGGFNAAP